MKIKKNTYIILSIITVSLAIVSLIFLKLFFSLAVDEKDLNNTIITLFKARLNRAIKFEEARISLFGDITINRFDLSVSSDFNDNLSFIKAPVVIIDLDFIDLLMGRITLKGLQVEEAQMNILKPYGRDYDDILNQFTDLSKRINAFVHTQNDNFYVTIKNGSLAYREILKDAEIIVHVFDINASLNFQSENIYYTFSSAVSPLKHSDSPEGFIASTGEVNLSKPDLYRHNLKINDLDLSFFNQFIFQKTGLKLSLKGSISTESIFFSQNNELGFAGLIETNNLNVLTFSPDPHSLVSNENFNLKTNIKINSETGTITIEKLHFFDDIFSIKGFAYYTDNKDRNNIKLKFSSNQINLTELSNYISPFRNLYYTGDCSFSIDFDYDILKNITHTSKMLFEIADFNVKDVSEGQKKEIIEDLSANININNNKIDGSIKGISGNTDMNLTINTAVESWYPFKSSSEVALYSKKSEISLFCNIFSPLMKSLIEGAYEDSKKGYEELFFLQKPLGSFITNNDFIFDFNADKVLVANSVNSKQEKGFKNFAFGLSLKKGILSLRDFHLLGYDAQYKFDLQGYLFRDYPHITCTGSINKFDLGSLTIDAPLHNEISGQLDLTFEYELNIYRISHLIQNSRLSLYCNITDGEIQKSHILNKLKLFFNNNNYPVPDLYKDEFKSINISIQQYGENLYIRNFGYNGNSLTFNLNGKYTYQDGLDAAGGCTTEIVKKKDETEYRKKEYIPFRISGPLTGPCMDLRKKNESSQTCF